MLVERDGTAETGVLAQSLEIGHKLLSYSYRFGKSEPEGSKGNRLQFLDFLKPVAFY
jgi:hypothetical protein